jgi:hypothetical protein
MMVVDENGSDIFWFMSYVTISRGGLMSDPIVKYSSCTYQGNEKPWEMIDRFNKNNPKTQSVLLSFQLCRGFFMDDHDASVTDYR